MLGRSRRRRRFPDYGLLTEGGLVGLAEDRTRKLERIYHLSHHNAWDGKAELESALARHGGIKLPEDQREALARILSIVLWGELAAWIISAELAERIDDIEPKMAATSQTFDEARHFYVMRDYMKLLGAGVPDLGAYPRLLLREVLDSNTLVYKLVGMQLLVENAALSIFKMISRANIEPVLGEILVLYQRDEARHIGLGVNYLPALMKRMSRYELLKLNIFQARLYSLIFWDSVLLRDDFEKLGLDINDTTRFSLKLQMEIATAMGRFSNEKEERKGGRGVYVDPDFLRKTHSFSVDGFLPREEFDVPPWQAAVLRMASRIARVGANAIDRLDP